MPRAKKVEAEETTQEAPQPPVTFPAPSAGKGEMPVDANTEAYLKKYEADYKGALAEKVKKDAANPKPKLDLAKDLWVCVMCDQKFVSKDEWPACKWGCVRPVEERQGPMGHMTTKRVQQGT